MRASASFLNAGPDDPSNTRDSSSRMALEPMSTAANLAGC